MITSSRTLRSDVQHEEPFTSTSGTRSVQADFPRLDIAVAKVIVRRLVAMERWKGPSDLLIISDKGYEEWLDGQAVEFLRQQKAIRQGTFVGD